MSAATPSAELAAKAELLDLLLNATQDGILDWNLISGRARYNPRWQLLLGFDNGELQGRSESAELWQELVHPDDRPAVLRLLSDHLEQRWPFSTAIRMRHRSVGYRYILCRGIAHRDEQDRPVRMVIIFSDIDERIRGEGRQRALVSVLPDTMFRVRADGTISGVKHGRERAGSPFALLREGMKLAESFSDVRLLSRLRTALCPDGQVSGVKTLQVSSVTTQGGTIHHEIRIVNSVEDESVCIVRDVTEQRDLEGRLLETQKLGAIGQLAAGVAHEINTPMQFIGDNLHFATAATGDIIGLLERLKAAVKDGVERPLGARRVEELANAEADADYDYARDALPQALTRALDGVERVSAIVRAMKAFAHPGGDELAPTELKGLVESTVIVATNEWKYVADMVLQLDADLPPVPCIAGELNQVVLNLIVNASHAIGDTVGGTGKKGTITVMTTYDDTHAELRVSDTGAGIPEPIRARIFEPFFTTKEVGRGTGQGLALAYNCIVKRHRGTITFETQVGVGTTFIVRLPLVCFAGDDRRSEHTLTGFLS